MAVQPEQVLPAVELWKLVNNMRLIIFTRYPEAGRVKTRLIPALGEKGAEILHRKMVELTLAEVRVFGGEFEVHFSEGSYPLMKNWLGEELRYRAQKGSSLGERLYNAVDEAFAENKKKVVVIGSDCPGLTSKHIERAFCLLDCSDLVLGPAFDGGYYLIGLKKVVKELFSGIKWGSDLVYRQTIEAAERANLKVAELEKLADIDCPSDLPCLVGLKNDLSSND